MTPRSILTLSQGKRSLERYVLSKINNNCGVACDFCFKKFSTSAIHCALISIVLMTIIQVLREFLDTFDAGGKDGIVTFDEFCKYYSNVSSSIDDDDYFELMIRNAWHISGGQGWCANTSNRRVLVTQADGTQTVQEIRNDIGIKADDKAAMKANLEAQGIHAGNIELSGLVDTRKPSKNESKGSSLSSATAPRNSRFSEVHKSNVVLG